MDYSNKPIGYLSTSSADQGKVIDAYTGAPTNFPGFAGVGDGLTDNGPLFQAAYDAGNSVQLANGTFIIASPFFDDNPDQSRPFVIQGKGVGTRLTISQAGLPRVSSFVGNPNFNPGDVTTRWAILSNANRTALKAASAADAWAALTAYLQGQVVTDGAGHAFACTTAGTSAASPPTWSTSTGATTTDGSVTWTSLSTSSFIDLGQGTTMRNTASGGLVRFPRIILRDLVLDGAGANAGFLFGAGATVTVENCVLINWKYLFSYTGYTDSCSFENIHATLNANPSSPIDSSWLVYGFANGDGHRFDRIKCYTKCGIASLFGNQGMVASAITGGAFRLKSCRQVQIEGWHVEMNVPDAMPVPNLYMDRSEVNLKSVFWQPGNAGTNYFAQINDDSSVPEDSSHLDMDGCGEKFRVIAGQPDQVRDPGIYVTAMNDGGIISQRNPVHTMYSQGNTSMYPDGPYWDSAISSLATAWKHPSYSAQKSAHPLLARGSITRKRAGSWVLEPLDSLPGVQAIVPQATPTSLSAISMTGTTQLGTITASVVRNYAIMTIDSDGLVSQPATVSAPAATSSRGNSIAFTITGGSTAVMMFYAEGATDPLVTPAGYTIIPTRGIKHRVFDEGANVNGRPWVLTSVPVPNTIAAATTSLRNRLLVGGSDYSGLLCTPTQYKPGVAVTITTTSTSLVAVDSANINTGRFIAPASGNVLVRWSALLRNSTAGQNVVIGLLDHDAGTQVGELATPGSVANFQIMSQGVLVTGLTAGKSYLFDLAWAVQSGTGQISAGRVFSPWSSQTGPVRMEVWAA